MKNALAKQSFSRILESGRFSKAATRRQVSK